MHKNRCLNKRKDAYTSSDKRWITLENGEHVLIDKEGSVLSGVSGGMSGERLGEAKTEPKYLAHSKEDWYNALKNFKLHSWQKKDNDTREKAQGEIKDVFLVALRNMSIDTELPAVFHRIVKKEDGWHEKYNDVIIDHKLSDDFFADVLAGNIIYNTGIEDETLDKVSSSLSKVGDDSSFNVLMNNKERPPWSENADDNIPRLYLEYITASTEYKNPYVTDEERKKFRDEFFGIAESAGLLGGFNSRLTPKAYQTAGSYLLREISRRATIRHKKEKYYPQTQGLSNISCEDVFDVLQDIRDFGISTEEEGNFFDAYCGAAGKECISQKRLSDIIHMSLSVFPTDWLHEISGKVELEIIPKYVRSFYRDGSPGYIKTTIKTETENLKDSIFSTSPLLVYVSNIGLSSIIAHELGHMFENNIYSIRESSISFLQERTKGLEKELYLSTPENGDEFVIKDSFFSSYVGKIYPGGIETEILSMFIGECSYSFDILKSFNYKKGGDRESLPYFLGLIATMGLESSTEIKNTRYFSEKHEVPPPPKPKKTEEEKAQKQLQTFNKKVDEIDRFSPPNEDTLKLRKKIDSFIKKMPTGTWLLNWEEEGKREGYVKLKNGNWRYEREGEPVDDSDLMSDDEIAEGIFDGGAYLNVIFRTENTDSENVSLFKKRRADRLNCKQI